MCIVAISFTEESPLVENVDRKSLPDSSDLNENFSNDVLELFLSSNEITSLTDEENQAPITIEEVAKDLQVSEKDSELLELEMRARAIRSLLKAKCQAPADSNSKDCTD
ncbi:uncharacterized protein NPIL_263751 [Nephila pilipes]|uniref:Uncharacterized protein n=1 Tax=Nephila pilipes TaxID=299642 RepID=A0A8X6UME5_NEPPI|nr:uncharacterized protein NPIL_263751 [Nephila pilipes]